MRLELLVIRRFYMQTLVCNLVSDSNLMKQAFSDDKRGKEIHFREHEEYLTGVP